MTLIVVHPKVCTESAQRLTKAIGGISWNPRKDNFPYQLRGVDCTFFNYGFGDGFDYAGRGVYTYNTPATVRISSDKIKTYAALKRAGIPTCNYVLNDKEVPEDWNQVVCRETATGRNCEGVMICPKDDLVYGCPLYTEYFEHDEEHRIVVFNGQVVARYMKSNLLDGQYELTYMLPQGYEELDKAAIMAVKAVGLDYAGVDCLFNNKTGAYIVLELNSGPILTDEVEEFFVEYFKEKL